MCKRATEGDEQKGCQKQHERAAAAEWKAIDLIPSDKSPIYIVGATQRYPRAFHRDGLLDRKRLGALIFSDPEKRRNLEEILHPAIRKLAEERIADAAAANHKRLIYMAPLLIEAGASDRVDTVWVVTVRPEIQMERLMLRDGIDREQAERIIASQMPLSEKERYGSVVIDNSGTEGFGHPAKTSRSQNKK